MILRRDKDGKPSWEYTPFDPEYDDIGAPWEEIKAQDDDEPCLCDEDE